MGPRSTHRLDSMLGAPRLVSLSSQISRSMTGCVPPRKAMCVLPERRKATHSALSTKPACAKWRSLTWGYERAQLNVKESAGLSRPDATGALDVRARPKEILRTLFRLPPSPYPRHLFRLRAEGSEADGLR